MLPRLMMFFMVFGYCFSEMDLKSAYAQGRDFALKQVQTPPKKQEDVQNKCVISQKIEPGQNCVNPGKQRKLNEKNVKSDQELLVFVSFSMPRESLRKLLIEGALYKNIKITFLLKGLKDDSFQATVKELSDMPPLIVNPKLFEAHQVKVVPTFVLLKKDHAIHRLSGHVGIDFVLDKFGVEA